MIYYSVLEYQSVHTVFITLIPLFKNKKLRKKLINRSFFRSNGYFIRSFGVFWSGCHKYNIVHRWSVLASSDGNMRDLLLGLLEK